MTTERVIEAVGVRKHYKGGTEGAGLNGFDLEVTAGTVTGLLGPNGAGKTTAVRILSTLLELDSGTATIAGYDVRRQGAEVRRRIGLVGQYAAIDDVLTGRQNLVMFGRLNHLGHSKAVRRADELLERFSLTEAAGQAVSKYSGGMRRRLDLAASLIVAPAVLFVDEPTTGLDPAGRLEVWSAVRQLVDGGTTVLLTTQYLEEADQLANRISMLKAGKVVAEGTPDDLKTQLGSDWLDLVLADPADVPRVLRVGGTLGGRGDPGQRRTDQRAGEGPYAGARGDGQLVARGKDRTGGHYPAQTDIGRGLPAPDRGGGGGMTALGWALADSWTIARRTLVHWRMQPGIVIFNWFFPVLMLLMFGALLGGAMDFPDGESYYELLVPGIFALAMLFGLEGTMTAVTTDAAKGVTDRFRSLPMSSAAVVIGRCIADMLDSAVTLLVLVATGLALGWRWHEGVPSALAAFGLLLLLRFALLWVGIFIGLTVKNAQSVTMVQVLVWPIGFLSSAFVATSTMPSWLGTIAQWNPLSATATASRALFGNPDPSATWIGAHAEIAAVIAPLLLIAVFLPLSAHRFRTLSR